MGYIGLIIVVLLGASIAGYQSFGTGFSKPATGQTESEVKNVLDSARVAASQLEGDKTESEETPADPVISKDSEVTVTSKDETPVKSNMAVLPENRQIMLVAGGCFWCVEADLEKLPGVLSVVSGYGGGATQNPTYQNYAQNGHREVVEVTYDANRISYEQILIYAMKHMDPTDDKGSFGDRGEYYSPAFYYKTQAEKTIIENLITEVNDKGPYDKDLGIDVEATPVFNAAEDYHQDYYKGTLSQVKYIYYRNASGRDAYIKKWWGTDTGVTLPWRKAKAVQPVVTNQNSKIIMWKNYIKPADAEVKAQLSAVAYDVTQHEGTERSGTSPLDKNYERGIYVDVLSGEPLFSSRDKFDSGTGWPSFVAPISNGVVTEHVDKGFFSTRTEIRSTIADNHIGHVFSDGPADRGGKRYCMNGVSLTFIPEAEMESKGYGEFKARL